MWYNALKLIKLSKDWNGKNFKIKVSPFKYLLCEANYELKHL